MIKWLCIKGKFISLEYSNGRLLVGETEIPWLLRHETRCLSCPVWHRRPGWFLESRGVRTLVHVGSLERLGSDGAKSGRNSHRGSYRVDELMGKRRRQGGKQLCPWSSLYLSDRQRCCPLSG